jgi:hypothetical protein
VSLSICPLLRNFLLKVLIAINSRTVGNTETIDRGLGSRVLELGGESGTDRHPTVYLTVFFRVVR